MPQRTFAILVALTIAGVLSARPQSQSPLPSSTYQVNDSHVHLTNYIQEGTNIHAFLDVMGHRVGRAVLFGIPLQQTWAWGNTGAFAPTYYLQSDAPLYYYS